MCSRQLSTFAGSFSCQRGVSVVSAMRATIRRLAACLPFRLTFSSAARPRAAARARRPLVEALRRGVDRLLELGRDEPVGAAEERLRDAVELLAEPVGGLLADRAHPVLELDRARLAACVDLARRRALEMLDLPALELGERELDARARLALRAVDLLGHRVLVLAETLVQLVDRATSVVGLHLELLERAREGLACARLELLAEADRGDALLVDGGVELVRLGGDPRLDVGDALTHALLERGDRALERVLGALEIGLPGAQPLLDTLLDGGDELGHSLRELALAHRELAAALIREAALLGDVRRERVGLGARDRDAELLGLRGRFLLGRGAYRPARLRHELLRACRASSRVSRG